MFCCHFIKFASADIVFMKKNLLFIALIGIFASQMLMAQGQKPDYRKLHYLSEEEMNKPFDFSKDFVVTDPPVGIIRNVAEFDQMQSVLVAYPFGVPIELIREMAENILVTTIVANAYEQQTVTNIYATNNVNLDNCAFLLAITDSKWVRDYGPWFVFDGNKNPGIVDFPYNRARPNDNNIPARVAQSLGIDLYGMNLISTGGNYMCDGMGKAASTDLVWDENPSLSHTQVSDLVNNYLNNSPYMVTEDPLGDYIKHIDCWGKFLSPGKVIIGQVPITDSRYADYEAIAFYFTNTISSWGYPYEVVRVFTPGTYPNTPYTNSLILNKKVFVPITGSQWDDEALAVYEEAMPGYEIIGVMYNGWENTDALHCRTKGIADLGMLYIHHLPLLGEVDFSEEIELAADVISYSGESIYQDSVFIYYRFRGGVYQHTTMTHVAGDTYTGTIIGINPGDTVDYYLFAADASNRRSFSPYIGEPDPFEFYMSEVTELTFNPDSVLFQTIEQMELGLPLDIINGSSEGIMVNSITEMGDEFMWFVDEMPTLPLNIPSGDTLSLVIKCIVPVQFFQTYITDSLYVDTEFGIFGEPIIIDGDLISSMESGVNRTDYLLYPNPASSVIHISTKENIGQEVRLSVYSLSGNMVLNTMVRVKNNHQVVFELPETIPSGTYVFEVVSANATVSGKVLVIR